MPVIFLLAAFFAAIYGIKRFYKKIWSGNLQVSIAFQDMPANEGERGQLIEIIRNEKKYPLPVLNVKFQTSRYLRFSTEDSASVSDLTYKNDIFALMPYQQIKRTLTFECRKRGCYHIDRAELVTGFMFFDEFYLDTRKQDTSIYVYPAILELPQLNCFLSQVIYSNKSSKRLYDDPFSFAGIREYQPYDPQKLINWKASARQGSLMVNIREYTSGQPVLILVNLEKTVTWHMEAVLEESIRLAVTAADAFMREGIPVSVFTTHDKTGPTAMGCSEKTMDEINKRMALIELSDDGESYEKWLSETVPLYAGDEYTYLCISHDETRQMYAATESFSCFVKELWQIRPALLGTEPLPHSRRIHIYERSVSYNEQEYGHRPKDNP